MICGLVFRSSLGCLGRDLLEKCEDAKGAGDGGLVEEGYDIEAFVLK